MISSVEECSGAVPYKALSQEIDSTALPFPVKIQRFEKNHQNSSSRNQVEASSLTGKEERISERVVESQNIPRWKGPIRIIELKHNQDHHNRANSAA